MRQRVWELLLKLVAALMWLWPRQRRLRAALRLLQALLPLLRWLVPAPPYPQHLDSYLEQILLLTLSRLTQFGIEFTSALTVRGAEVLDQAGAIIITGHFSLNGLALRWLHEQGWPVTFVAGYQPVRPRLLGTRVLCDFVKADHLCLVRIRRRVGAGHLIAAAIERTEPHADWQTIDTPARPLFVSDLIIRLAERNRLPLVFAGTRLTADGRIALKLVRPSATQTAAVLDEFGRFLRTELSRDAA